MYSKLENSVSDAFKSISESKFDEYKDIAKQIANTEVIFVKAYELIKEKVGKDITKEQAYALFIVDVRNALNCLKRVENILIKHIK
jgi:hypothetical protein